MAIPNSTEPGVYHFIYVDSFHDHFRRFKNNQWHAIGQSIEGALGRTDRNFTDEYYEKKVSAALSVTRVADLAGNLVSIGPDRTQTQLDLFQ